MVRDSASSASGSETEERRLWIINQYAIAANQPGITRHAMLAAQLRHMGWATSIFSSSTHYWNLTAESGTQEVERRPEATFIRIATAASVTNGARRVLSMVGFSLRIFRVAMRRLTEERPNAVLGSSPHLFGAVAALAIARRTRVPFVLEVRDVWPESLIQLLGLSRRHPLVLVMNVVERFLYRRADVIVSVLPGLAPHVERVAGRVRAPLVFVPNGVSLDRDARPPGKRPPKSGSFNVMYAGAHGVPNCLDDLLAAAAIVQSHEGSLAQDDRTRFTLIGDGKEKASLIHQAKSMGLTNVTFHAPVAKAELAIRLREADCFALLWRDTPLYRLGVSPNKLFDYFAAARPVIMGINSPFDPVREAGAGVSVPAEAPEAVAAAIEKLRSMSASEREVMGLAGFEYLRDHHDVGHLAERYAAALEAALHEVAAQRDHQGRVTGSTLLQHMHAGGRRRASRR